jgi:tetratricopeptide (TPR) repeat protein
MLANRNRVLAGGIVVVLIAAVTAFYVINKNQHETDANQEFMSQPLGMSAADSPSVENLLGISQHYAGTSAGADAQLLAAKELFLNSKFDESEQAFNKFITENPGNPLVPQAQVGVAVALESAGKVSDAVTKYKEIAAVYASQPNIAFPVKLTLGRLSEAQGKPDLAVSFYEDLARVNDTRDPWVAEAQERLRILLAKHPELDKSAGANPYQTPSPLAPTAADTQLSAPQESAPAPTAAPAANSNQPSALFPTMESAPPAAAPGGSSH